MERINRTWLLEKGSITMNALVILNHKPYDGSGVVWNGLRLAGKLLD